MKNIFVHLASLAGLAVLINLLLEGVQLEDALFKGAITGIGVFGIFKFASTFVQRILENVDDTFPAGLEDDDFDMESADFDTGIADEADSEDENAPETATGENPEQLKKAA